MPETAPRPDVPDELLSRFDEEIGEAIADALGEELGNSPRIVELTTAVMADVSPKLVEFQRRVRERVAAELRAAAHAIEDSTGEIHDRLAEEIWGTCERDPEAPAVRDDPRTIAAVAYRHIAYRIDGEAR